MGKFINEWITFKIVYVLLQKYNESNTNQNNINKLYSGVDLRH